MLQRFCFFLLLCCCTGKVLAQDKWPSPEVEQAYNQARQYLSSGNFKPAIAAYQQLIQLAPDKVMLYRDLGQAYYLSGDYKQADRVLNSMIDRDRTDETVYQLEAASQKAQGKAKDARKMLEQGLERYPSSGLLYHEYGKQYEDAGDYEKALQQWLTGIGKDPANRLNYYDAARAYMHTDKVVWAILYGELFVNMEPLTPRGNETRKMVLAAYKRFYLTPHNEKAPEYGKQVRTERATTFEAAVTQGLQQLSPVISDGITVENLTMLRTRFIADWYAAGNAERYPFGLFTWHDAMLRNGHYEAYNEWLLARADNEQEYTAWNAFHPEAIKNWQAWQQAHPLQPSAADNYNDGKTKGLFPKK